MAQIINISNSADYKSMNRSATPSEDEDESDSHHHFLRSSSNSQPSNPSITITIPTDVAQSNLTLISNSNDNDSILTTDEYLPSNLINDPSQHPYVNLSSSSSEASLARPLLQEKNRVLSVYPSNINPDETRNKSVSTPSDSIVSNSRTVWSFYLTDMLISALIITPLVNIHWRGAWDLLDLCLLPKHERTSALISLILGLILLYLLYLTQKFLQIFYDKHQNQFLGRFLNRFYTLIIAFAYINQWRGLWNLLDFTSNSWHYLFIETLISVGFLLILKSVYNLNSAPFLIGTDTECSFLIESKYQITNNRFLQYTFDFIIYEIVEAPLVVIAWRGLYNLSDLYIYPSNKTISMLISLMIGYALFLLLGLIQIPVLKCFIKQRHDSIHLWTSNLFHLIAFISVVQIWRSLWMMCEQYIDIPGYHFLTLWLCYIGAYAVLTCGLAACSLNGPGGSKESYIDGPPILLFKFEYMSTLIKNHSVGLKRNRGDRLIVDTSSTETIVTPERPYRYEPP